MPISRHENQNVGVYHTYKVLDMGSYVCTIRILPRPPSSIVHILEIGSLRLIKGDHY